MLYLPKSTHLIDQSGNTTLLYHFQRRAFCTFCHLCHSNTRKHECFWNEQQVSIDDGSLERHHLLTSSPARWPLSQQHPTSLQHHSLYNSLATFWKLGRTKFRPWPAPFKADTSIYDRYRGFLHLTDAAHNTALSLKRALANTQSDADLEWV